MADKILGSDIVDQSVEVELLKVDKLMDNLLDKFIKTAAGAKELNTALKNAGSTNEVTKGVNGYSASLTELDKIKRDLVKANEKLIASQTLEAQLLSELKSRQVEENKTTREFIRDKKMQEGSIDQLNAKLVQMKRAYTELAQAERDAAKGQQMLAHIQAVRDEVGRLEASMGMFNKNVGNYKSGFSAINNSVMQIGREMPAFVNSINTGFMAISNNLPALFDAIKDIREQNKLAMAEAQAAAIAKGAQAKAEAILQGATDEASDAIGEQAKALAMQSVEGIRGRGVLQQLAGAVFSWQTLLAVGITLLTAYGGKIWDYIAGNKEAAKKTKETKITIDDLTDSYEAMNMAVNSSDYKTAIQNINKLSDEVELAKKGFISKEGVVKDYNETLGKTMGIVTSLNEVEQKLIDNKDAYVEMMLYKAAANMALEKAAGLALKAEEKRREKEKANLSQYDDPSMGQGFFENFMTSMKGKLPVDVVMDDMQKGIDETSDSMEEWNGIAKDFLTKAGEISKLKGFNFFGDTKEDNTKVAKEKKVKEAFTFLPPDLTPTEDEINNIEKYYIRLRAEQLKIIKEYFDSQPFQDALASDIKEMMAHMDELTKQGGDLSGAEAFDLNALLMGRGKNKKTDAKEREAEIRNYFNIVNQGLSSIQVITDTLKQIEEERFRLQEEQMNTYYDAEEERIKQSGKSQAEQQEALMKLAAQREAQQKKIDADRAQAQRKAAARQKAIDIAQVIANTALAVTAALTDKTLGPIGRAAAAIAAGITGTAQLAAIIATPLPQYKDGTDSHKGGFAVVGDGGEHELIVEPSGKSYLSPNKSTIMNLPAKTKVIPQKKLLQMVTDATHVSLANTSTPITEGMYINEMIAQYDKLASKVDRLSNVMEAKNMQTNIYSDYDHNLHVQRNRF